MEPQGLHDESNEGSPEEEALDRRDMADYFGGKSTGEKKAGSKLMFAVHAKGKAKK
jgi:hypothetical protein